MIIAKKCRFCQRPFDAKFSSTQTVCSPGCGIALAQTTEAKKREKEYDKVTREKKEALRDKKWYAGKLKDALHYYIRNVRDKYQPCISCGKPYDYIGPSLGGGWDAGHYCSVAAHIELKFEERNIHKQCKYCNKQGEGLGGNYINYRLGLINRYGQDYVDWLEGPHEMPKLTIEEIKLKMAHYKKLIKEMKE